LKFYVNETKEAETEMRPRSQNLETEMRPRRWSVETETFNKTPQDRNVRDRDYNPNMDSIFAQNIPDEVEYKHYIES